jgi:hypothetical protein
MPVAARRRRPEPEPEEDEEPPRRRRVSEEEEVAPASRRRRPEPESDDEEEEDIDAAPRARRRPQAADDEDDRGDRPRRRPGGSRSPSGGAGRRPGNARPGGRVASGWGGYTRVKAATSDFETKYKPSEKGDVVQLLEPEPFAAFARHWVELADKSKRALICPASLEVDDDDEIPECPLCDVGDKANAAKAYINVAVLKPGARPELMVWEIGGSISDQLQTIDKAIGRRTSLTDVYLLASSTGSGMTTKYALEPLFEDDLEEFDVKPLTPKQAGGFDLYDASLYEVPTLKELNKIADEIA